MDPAQLPIELFAHIIHCLSPRHVWLLRCISKPWCHALQSSVIAATLDFDSVRSRYTAKPLGCQDVLADEAISRDEQIAPARCVLCNDRFAWLVDGRKENYRVNVRDLRNDHIIRYHGHLDGSPGIRPSTLLLSDIVVATIVDMTLDVLSHGRHCQIPGRFPIKAACCHNQRIAVLNNGEANRDPAAFWLYDVPSDSWSRIEIPDWHMTEYPGHSICLDPDLHVFSVRRPIPDARGHTFSRIMDVWTPAAQHTVIYMLPEPSFNTRSFSPTNRTSRIGNTYRIKGVWDTYLTLDEGQAVSLGAPTACSGDAVFAANDLGIQTNRGLIKGDWKSSSPVRKRPLEVLANEHYVVSIHPGQGGLVTEIYIFYLRRKGKILTNFVWEDDGSDE